jgi:hypothetical protein
VIDRSYTRETAKATSTTGYGSACPGEGTQQDKEKEGRRQPGGLERGEPENRLGKERSRKPSN